MFFCCIDWTSLELGDLPASVCQVLGLKVCIPHLAPASSEYFSLPPCSMPFGTHKLMPTAQICRGRGQFKVVPQVSPKASPAAQHSREASWRGTDTHFRMHGTGWDSKVNLGVSWVTDEVTKMWKGWQPEGQAFPCPTADLHCLERANCTCEDLTSTSPDSVLSCLTRAAPT